MIFGFHVSTKLKLFWPENWFFASPGNILGGAQRSALITCDMVNMLTEEGPPSKKKKFHNLSPYNWNHLQPKPTAYHSLNNAIQDAWAISQMTLEALIWSPHHMDKSGVVAAHNMFQQTYSNLAQMAPNSTKSSLLFQSFIVAQRFYVVMAGLSYLFSYAAYRSKFKVPTANFDFIQKHLCWLSG